jgi:DNA-binding transcriptional LysR family regulator
MSFSLGAASQPELRSRAGTKDGQRRLRQPDKQPEPAHAACVIRWSIPIVRITRTQDILAFTRVAELGSFSAAARAIGVTTSSITKSVLRLETELGVQLFHRTTRAVVLTEPGQAYCDRCIRLLDDLEEAEAAIKKANLKPTGTVRLSLPPSFARRTLVPALASFFERYPGIQIDLHLKAQTSNPIQGGFDLTVHSGNLLDSALVNRVLIRGPQKTVASPYYLERFGTPLEPSDLVRHNCIVGGFGPEWKFREADGTCGSIHVSGNLQTDSGDLILEAALAGLGISQATWWLFKEDLRAGKLVPILERYEIEAEPISIVLPERHRVPARVRAVVEFLLEITR